MPRATRAKPAPKEPTPEPAPASTKPLPEATPNPPKLFILPKNTSKDARIITLANPATNTPSRYLFCPSKGFYEFTRVAAPKRACRSWLLTSGGEAEGAGVKAQNAEAEAETQTGLGSGFVTKDAALFLATPIDLLFLILPVLAPKSLKEGNGKQLFLALDDYVDALIATSPHWGSLLASHPSLRDTLEGRISAVCDTVDAGELMYRLSEEKLAGVLLGKAERVVAHGVPPSMDDRFVKTALERPILSVRREESSLTGGADEAATATPITPDAQTQPPTQAETADPETETDTDTPPSIPPLLRLQTTLTYLTTSYLPPTLSSLPTHPSLIPLFAPLHSHLSSLAALKAEATALRSISDNITRKRAVEEDEERALEREEKKRKKDEEKKKVSLGVRRLNKVDTSGMRKMSDFFGVKTRST